jgi:hypothetical protein
MRDIHAISRLGFPVWSKGITPLGCYNRKVEPSEEIVKAAKENRKELEGGIIVADDSGVTIIKKELINQKTLDRLHFIELQEDIWFYCLDTLKWSTYKTICLKDYLKYPDVLPKILRDKLEKLS